MTVRSGGRAVWVLGMLPAGALLGLLAATAGPVLPLAGAPYDPREKVKAPPPQQRDSVSPLDRVSAWLQSPDQQMFTVHTTAPENWRLAVLDRFDGETWTSGASFVPAGDRVPAGVPGPATHVDQRFVIQNLPGVWMPAADRPRSVTGLGVIADPASGMITSARPLKAGQAYEVGSTVPDYDPDRLAAAEPARDAQARDATALPESPGTTPANAQVPAFRRLAQQIVRDQGSPFQRAAKIAQYLSTTAKYDVSGLPGHSYAQLKYFLGHKSGTSEQFATAYAVLARSVGLPTRVVVGFRPGVGSGGDFEVRSGDVLVWPEVDFAHLGWVPFYPTPEREGSSAQSGAVPAGETQQKLQAAQKNAASTDQGQRLRHERPAPTEETAGTETTGRTDTVVGVRGGGLPLAVLAYLTAALALPIRRRRRRRTAPTPADRITGAWQQTVESLRATGLPPASTLTAHEVAEYGSRTIAGTERHLRPLADLVNRAEYAELPPDHAAAETAWHHTDRISRLTARSAGPARRTARRLHPRSLRPR